MRWRHVGKWRYSSTILILNSSWKWVVSFTHLQLYPRKRAPGIHWMGVRVGLRVNLDTIQMRNFSCPGRKSNPGRPARSLFTIPIGLLEENVVLQCRCGGGYNRPMFPSRKRYPVFMGGRHGNMRQKLTKRDGRDKSLVREFGAGYNNRKIIDNTGASGE
jgi:hypothetical protein